MTPITIIVNGKTYDTIEPFMTYGRVMLLTGFALDSGVVVTYKNALGSGNGQLKPGGQVKKTQGMVFTAVKPKKK